MTRSSANARLAVPAATAAACLVVVSLAVLADARQADSPDRLGAAQAAPSPEGKPVKADKSETDAYRGRLMACLARNGARVERLPDGGYSVFLSRSQADDEGQALRALHDQCQRELGYEAAPPPSAP